MNQSDRVYEFTSYNKWVTIENVLNRQHGGGFEMRSSKASGVWEFWIVRGSIMVFDGNKLDGVILAKYLDGDYVAIGWAAGFDNVSLDLSKLEEESDD